MGGTRLSSVNASTCFLKPWRNLNISRPLQCTHTEGLIRNLRGARSDHGGGGIYPSSSRPHIRVYISLWGRAKVLWGWAHAGSAHSQPTAAPLAATPGRSWGVNPSFGEAPSSGPVAVHALGSWGAVVRGGGRGGLLWVSLLQPSLRSVPGPSVRPKSTVPRARLHAVE